MAAMKPRTGDGPLEVTKEGRGIVISRVLPGRVSDGRVSDARWLEAGQGAEAGRLANWAV